MSLVRGALPLLVLLAACRSVPGGTPAGDSRPHEALNAVLWVGTAAEYRASALQAYRWASLQVDEALRPENRSWTADLEQSGDYFALPPAVILDVDDTILGTASFQARLVSRLGEFQQGAWEDWVEEARSRAIPGALEFANRTTAAGVRIFYVTNRHHRVEAATRRNLEALGFPVEPNGENILSRRERSEWERDKTARRRFVAQTHRVLLIVGDDLNDFVPGSRADPEQRAALASRHASFWGTRWILLPNPVYGDWERALWAFDRSLGRDEILQRKHEELDALDSH
jgi:acid phosphatase